MTVAHRAYTHEASGPYPLAALTTDIRDRAVCGAWGPPMDMLRIVCRFSLRKSGRAYRNITQGGDILTLYKVEISQQDTKWGCISAAAHMLFKSQIQAWY